MKFFIASHSQIEAKKFQDKLIEAGHEVTSRWITEDTKFHKSINAYTDEERTRLSQLDEEDVKARINLLEKAFRMSPTQAVKKELNLIRRNGVVGEALLKRLSDIYFQHRIEDRLGTLEDRVF